MKDQNQSPQTEIKAHNPERMVRVHHAYNAPDLSPKEFLLRVMHDPSVPIRDRLDAASKLLRLYPFDWDPPRCKIIIGGIPSSYDHGSCSESDHPREGESTENHSQHREFAQIALSHSGDPQAPVNIETIINDIKSGNFPEPILCTRCGHHMPYPCSTSKSTLN
jgi:hypothetical protein